MKSVGGLGVFSISLTAEKVRKSFFTLLIKPGFSFHVPCPVGELQEFPITGSSRTFVPILVHRQLQMVGGSDLFQPQN